MRANSCLDYRIVTTAIILCSCHSAYGMIPRGQSISIGRGCESKGIVQHEILHALGRVHEHTQLDRDRYLYVFTNHVKPSMYNVM